jgi:putative transposase
MFSARAYRFRVYPDRKRSEEIDCMLILAQRLYNGILEKARAGYEKDRNARINESTLNGYMKETIANDKELLKLYSQTRQDIFIRVLKAYQNFFRRCKEKKQGKRMAAGFPRFKSRDRYRSLTYPQDNGAFTIEKNRLRVARIGTMRIELHREMEGKIKTMMIKRDAGDYYAVFTTVRESAPNDMADTQPVGIDMGLDNFVALSDGKTIKKPRFFKMRARRIARWQIIIARRSKGSKRRDKAKLQLEEEWKNVTNQSNDFEHKLSTALVKSGYTSFAVEKLNVQDMMKNHNFAQSIQNASWNRFIQMLSYKAESAGMKFIEVNAANTTKTCSNCGNIQEMPLSTREYICSICGLQIDRDINASINILKRGRAGLARTYAQGDSVRLRQGAAAKELRTYSVIDNRGGSPHL